MPRLTDQRYVEIHRLLRRYWLDDPALYAHLTPGEQWNLHDFFQSYKTLGDADLVAHRRAVSLESPSLPHRAGRALRKLKGVIETIDQQRAHSSATVSHKHPSIHNLVKVWPLVQPEIDANRVARALIALAKHKVKSTRRKY